METSSVPPPRSVVIPMLSKRLYSSLASAMREVTSNSSDASASEVRVSFYNAPTPAGDEYHLTFFDDGSGMRFDENDVNGSDFVRYLTIGGSGRRESEGRDQTESGRPLIGFMGVGSLAVAPWCKYIVVLTKKKGEQKALHARVDFNKFFEDRGVQQSAITDQYRFEWELVDVPAEDVTLSYTTLDMVGLRESIANQLSEPIEEGSLGLFERGYAQFTGLTPRNGRRSFKDYKGLLRFMHDLALMIPVAYPPGGPINDPPRKILADTVEKIVPSVVLQGVKLHRPMWVLGNGLAVYDPDSTNVGDCGVYPVAQTLPSGVHVEGYIYWQSTQLFFQDLTGVQIRVNQVGIGLYDPSWLHYSGPSFGARDKNITGEIFIQYSDALHDALKSDREGFDEDSGIYKELQSCLHGHLQIVLNTITRASARRNNQGRAGATSRTNPLPPVAPPVPSPSMQYEAASQPLPNVPQPSLDLLVPVQTPQPAAPANPQNTVGDRSLSFTIALNAADEIDVKFEDVCLIDADPETGKVTVTVVTDHPVFEAINLADQFQVAAMLASMATATVAAPEANPKSILELALAYRSKIGLGGGHV